MRTIKSFNYSVVFFLFPFMAIYLVFQIFPLFHALFASFFKWDLLTSGMTFKGLANYTRMLKDPTFWSSFFNTLKFVLYSTPLLIIIGLIFAILLNKKSKVNSSFRTAFFAPYVFSVSVTTLIWGFMFNPQKGLIGKAFTFLDLPVINWLTDPHFAMAAIIICTLWWTVGFNMILLLAGLQDIDPFIYEASSIDGAKWYHDFFHITVPSLKRTIELVAILQIIASFQIFGQVYILTKGGPGGTTRVLIQYIYETGFRDYQLGYASAMAVFLFLAMFAISLIQLTFKSEKKNAKE